MTDTTVPKRPLGSHHVPDSAVPWIRRMARLGGLGMLGWLGWRLSQGLPALGEEGFAEAAIELGLWFIAGIGFVLALEWEIQGATILAAAGAGMALWSAQFHDPLYSFLMLCLFLGPAALYWLDWQRYKPLWEVFGLLAVLATILVGSAIGVVRINDALLGPTHPASAAPRLPDSPVDWLWSGGLGTDHAEVRARVVDHARTRLAVSTDPDLGAPQWFAGRSSSAEDPGLVAFSVDDLEPATTYHYGVEVNGELDTTRTGTLATFDEGPWSFKLVAGSCARIGSNGSVFDTIREMDPDLFLMTGDLHYGDVATNNRQRFRELYDGVFAQPGPAALYRSVPTDYVWDDHDFGPNDADSTSNSRPAAQTVYREVVPHSPLERDGQQPIYRAFTMGRARVIVTDTRSARSPKTDPDGPGKTMLGADQLEWFQEELVAADEQYPLIIWVNSVPWIAEAKDGADHWGGYDHERRLIADFIAENDIDGLLMLAGDAHMVAADDGTNSDYSSTGGAGFPVLHGASLDRPGSDKGGPYSEGTFPGGGRFSTVEVEDDGTEVTVTIAGQTWDDRELLSYTFSVDGEEEADASP
ncbi:MAG: alkaline phosphatase [Acidimicrobiales bacterium]